MSHKTKPSDGQSDSDLVTLSFKAPRALRNILDSVVGALDTDRSKFIREAIREHSARKRPSKSAVA